MIAKGVSMGLLDFKGSRAVCPECGSRRAKKSLWRTRCVNPNCSHFDAEYAAQANANRIENKDAVAVFPHLQGNFTPGIRAIRIRYENHRGDLLNYLADTQGAYHSGEFVLFRVAPTGRRIAFRLASILNRSEVEQVIAAEAAKNLPNADQRRILNYHLRRGTSSPRFVEVRQKYPDFQI